MATRHRKSKNFLWRRKTTEFFCQTTIAIKFFIVFALKKGKK